jgi:DNA polymerase II small subunit
MRDELVAYFESHRKLVEAGALQLLLESPQPLVLSRRLLEVSGSEQPLVTREMVELAIAGGFLRAPAVLAGPVRPDAASGGPPEPVPFALVAEGFNEAAVGRGPLEAYEGLFLSRFRALGRLLRGRPDLPDVRPIRELGRREGPASVIGMIREIRQTEKRHLMLTLEDESGSREFWIPRDVPEARETFLLDEVVGLHVQVSSDASRLPRVLGVHRPEVRGGGSRRRAGRPHRLLLLSDLHVGSRSFLSDAWASLADFLHGRGPRPELAAEVDHVVVAGDLVDGIGIYPNQERDLAIGDIFEQYAELGRRLADLPSRLTVVVVPGNHDAVCPAEPQPALPPELAQHLPKNVRVLGNPSTFAIHGVVVEAYHGRSFDDLIPAIPGASYARPTDVMKRMLAMRHLAPMYGGRTPLAPLPRDGLVIDPAPDILVTGHAHTFGVDQYRGVLLVNASTWQAETEYQRMRNISPVPARAAVVNLADLTLESLDFSSARPRATGVAA